MAQVQISVILPVYNCENYVKEAIESILNQTYKHFELIIINDGSTDNSVKIIESFRDERIVFINNKLNSGLIKTLNEGIRISKGKYIARMDSDDVSLAERFEEQIKIFENNKNAVIVSSDYYLMNGNRLKRSYNFSDSDELKTVLLFAPCFAHPTVMIKNIFIENNLYYDERFSHTEDYKLWIDLTSLGEFVNVNKPLLKYRSHPAQVSVSQNKVQKLKSEEVRVSYLQKCGFKFSVENLNAHHLIGNNVFLTSLEQLKNIELWLAELISQNNKLNLFNKNMFNKVIGKFWYDSCGNTNLGMKSYRYYFGTSISDYYPLNFRKKVQLIGKCIIRKFRN